MPGRCTSRSACIAASVACFLALGLTGTAQATESPEATLARRPLVPLDHGVFNGPNTIGRRVTYADAPAMAPASGPAPTEAQASAMLDDYLAEQFPGDQGAQDAARAVFDDATAKQKIPNPSLRAALASLKGTFADGAVDFILHAQSGGQPVVTSVRFVDPSAGCGSISPGWVACSFLTSSGEIQFNSRYSAENPFLFSHIMAHEPLHSDAAVHNTEELVNAVLDTLVYLHQVADHPWIAQLGTELARRNNTYAVSLLNSGAGSQLGLYATNENRQAFPGSTTDTATSWSSGFDPPDFDSPGNPLLASYLGAIHEPGAPVCVATFNADLLDCLDANHDNGLTPSELVTAANAFELNTAAPVPPDTTPPAVAITSPVDGHHYRVGQVVVAGYACTDAGSGVAACTGPVASGARLDIASPGARTFTVHATDRAGLATTRTVHYTVDPASVETEPPPTAKISRAAIRRSLRRDLAHAVKALRKLGLAGLRGKRRFTFGGFHATTAGTAKARLEARPASRKHAHAAARRPLVVATATRHFARAGAGKLTLKLTRRGAARLEHSSRIKLTFRLTFVPGHGAGPAATTKRVTLRKLRRRR